MSAHAMSRESLLENVLAKCDCANYYFHEVNDDSCNRRFEQLLTATYETLRFPIDKVRSSARATRYALFFRDELAAICALQPVQRGDHIYQAALAGGCSAVDPRFLEVKNVIVKPEFRGTIAFGHLLYQCAKQAHRADYHALVGITRYQTLRYFVEYGVVPIDHEPLHLLDDPKLLDFVIYFDSSNEDSVRYMHERSKRYFRQVQVMTAIREKYIVRYDSKTLTKGGHDAVEQTA